MFNIVKSSGLGTLLSTPGTTSARPGAAAGDSFSQQLLLTLQDTINKLGLQSANLQVVEQGGDGKTCDKNSSQRQFLRWSMT
jgi:hypothetical protein